MTGEMVSFPNGVRGLAFNLEESSVGVIILGDYTRIHEGETVTATGELLRVPVGEAVMDAILALVRSGRSESTDQPQIREHVAWGPGPRASQALMLGVRARALIEGRLAPSVDDVLALARPEEASRCSPEPELEPRQSGP